MLPRVAFLSMPVRSYTTNGTAAEAGASTGYKLKPAFAANRGEVTSLLYRTRSGDLKMLLMVRIDPERHS